MEIKGDLRLGIRRQNSVIYPNSYWDTNALFEKYYGLLISYIKGGI